MNKMKTSAREAALLSLGKCSSAAKYANLEIDAAIKSHGLEGAEKALFSRLVYGVVEKRITLDYLIRRLTVREADSLDSRTADILRLGLYQLRYMDRIPASAACDESVKLAKIYSHRAAGLINAALREYTRRHQALDADIDILPRTEALSVKYSVPQWIISMWDAQYGQDRTEGILPSLEHTGRVSLRVNTVKTSVGALTEALRAAGFDASPSALSPCGVNINGGTSVSGLPGFKEGLFYVQDEASQLCASLLGAEKGMLVVDACASPGGKSFYAAMDMEGQGEVLSLDLHRGRLKLVEDGASRLGLDIIRTRQHNSSLPLEEYEGRADRVLCDVPCSGLGVMSKKPDIRHKNPEDIKRLPGVQLSILTACSYMVRSGGLLVYSTCTLNKDENEEVVRAFLSSRRDFLPVPLGFDGKGGDGTATFFPDIDKTDGFFVAKMVKHGV